MRKLTGLLLAAATIFLMLVAPAAAQEITNEATAVAPEAALTLSEWTVYAVVTLLIPVATAVVTKSTASVAVKHIATLFFASVLAIITTHTQIDGTAVISLTTLKYAGGTFLVAVFTYLGIYKQYNLNEKTIPSFGWG